MSGIKIAPHTKETATFTVQDKDLASAISPYDTDNYLNVLATPRVVAFMEIACARLLVPYLPANYNSVGARIDVTHSAPTPVGAEVTINAEFVKMKGKLFVFNVIASDAGGEVARATHERAIVDGSRIESGAMKRMNKSRESKA